MKCPTCDAEMAEVKEGELLVDQCSSCGGIWFDPDELGSYLSKRGIKVDFQTGKFEGFEKRELPFAELCPRCCNEKLVFLTSEDLSVSVCERCRGVFVGKSQAASLGMSLAISAVVELAPDILGNLFVSILKKLIPR